MYKFNRILIGLDFSLMDRSILEYSAMLCDKINPGKIYFTHIHRDLAVPDYIVRDFPELRQPMDEKLKKEMISKVETFFPDYNKFDVEFEVVEGSPSKELIHRLEVKNIDLLIMGKKVELKGLGVVPKQVARAAKSSILFVPEKAKENIKNIFIPIDFSQSSIRALEEGIIMAKQNPKVNLYPIHIYDLPEFGGGVSYGKKKLEPLIRGNALEDFSTAIQELDTENISINPLYYLNHKFGGVEIIKEKALKKEADLIIVGSQGKSRIQRWILGSFTEKLIDTINTIPLLVVKEKIDRT